MRAAVYKSEFRQLFRLALPLTAAQAGTQLMGLVDVAVLGRLGARELAAAALANAIFFAFTVMGMGMIFGIDPLISQAIGAGDHQRARRVLWQGVWLALVTAGVLMIALFGMAAALPHIGVEQELVEPATVYLVLRTLGLAPFLLFYVMRAYLQAYGATRPLLMAMILANVCNLGLDILLVFGWGPVPPLGVAGAAIATIACSILQLTIVAFAVRRVHAAPGLSRANGGLKPAATFDHRWDGPQIAQAFRVGFPVALQMGAEIGIFALVGVLAARLGTLHMAAHQIAIGLASFTYTVAMGISAAGSVRVGIGVGARDPVATRVAGHVAFIAGFLVMGVNAMAFAFAPRPLARLITDQATVIAASIPLLLVAAFFQLSDGVQAVGAGVLRGAGDTRFTLYTNLLGHWLIGFPIALWFGFHRGHGIVGLWWGLCTGLTVVAVLLFIRFERLSSKTIVPLAET